MAGGRIRGWWKRLSLAGDLLPPRGAGGKKGAGGLDD